MNQRGVVLDGKGRLLIESDDNPEGEGPRLAILGADDWYLSIVREDQQYSCDSVRFCTSGARSDARTMVIALLDAVCRGEPEKIRERAGAVVKLAELELPRRHVFSHRERFDMADGFECTELSGELRRRLQAQPELRLGWIDEQLRDRDPSRLCAAIVQLLHRLGVSAVELPRRER